MSDKTKNIITITLLTAVLAVYILFSQIELANEGKNLPYESDYTEVSYKDFLSKLKNNKLSVVYINDNKDYALGTNVYAECKNDNLVFTHNPNTDEFISKIYDSGVIVRSLATLQTRDDVVRTKKSIFEVFFFVYLLFYMIALIRIYNHGGLFKKKELVEGDGKNIFNKSKKDSLHKNGAKTFADIAGLKEVKKDMASLVDFLVNKEKYTSMGAKLPKGVILYGPPGTGKTLLAKAVANEAGVPFHYMSGSEFIEKYVGVGAQRVRELFDKARKSSPCIVFIDEIDTIGTQRSGHQHSEDRKTINALLTEMDGFNESENIIVIGATNRLEDLDDALTRPGRFTDKFCVSLPETAKERREVIDLYVANKKLDETVDLDGLSKELIGFSPAKIEALLNEAAIIAVQNDKEYISKDELDKALYKILLNGHEKEDQSERDKDELNVVAWHEAGHALIGKINGKDVTKVTIVSSTSGAGGVTFSTPKKGALHSIKDLRDEVKELYGGRVAEFIYFNNDKSMITTGASNDIERATNIITSMVDKYGMTDEFGLLNMEKINASKESIIKYKVNLAKELEKETYDILVDNYEKLESIANSLIENETITGKELDELLAS